MYIPVTNLEILSEMSNINPHHMANFHRMVMLGICSDYLADDDDDCFMTERELRQFENYCQKLKKRKAGTSLSELRDFLNLHCLRQDPTGRCLTAAFKAGIENTIHIEETRVTPLLISGR